MALSTAGSPIVFNMPKASRPAKKPTIIPRHNKDPVVIVIILNGKLAQSPAACSSQLIVADQHPPVGVRTAGALVAGEAEQMAAIVHELMHVHALDDRSRTLLRADEIDAEQANEAGENDPGQQFAAWDRSGPCRGGSKCRSCHIKLLGDSRPHTRRAWLQEQV